MANPRADFSPIFDRKPLKLPGGARVAVWPVINVEEWDINEPMARTVLPTPQGVSVIPDIPNFGWFDYGLRVGFWRMKQVLDSHGIRATVSLNASVCFSYPQIVTESVKSGWEMLAHSYIQRVINKEPDEREAIRRTISTIEEFTGKAPRGWMGPGLAETFDTPDILAEEGIEYVADWCNDDQPYPMKVKSGSLVAVPYTVELNDIPVYLVQHHRSPELFDRAKDHFDTLYREGEESARIMCVSTHPYITGAAHRIKYYDQIFEYICQHDDVVFMTGEEILDWYNRETKST
ncbi:MAG: polysaccharide deacetylase family protein [Chloroflexota bacterium]|jgi:peptidoglycan/xylan/chitin deacetylase (PgdA/CDA1 family)|nr:polysaccharide deacetylase family protein [Dehalococcoidia bacterium]MEC8855855.1 polysaccharide deacetylase family protein [Chloroflexota bacterium]PKB62345.1 MAG: polysaccharide deacetylase [SAR202 cluster bacterium Ae2-Chloro-G3]MEC8959865.1 polysaccharide deacetylase family protein [Chloroflexota bacterium]MEC9271632.1 polysaccharide deacetylase family protein [Chloroflexota bacterium]|tara:strand:+ start:3330 stop:4202 length:873 start_codon:yes stop_codon:yes gene_type:complete